MLVDVKKGPSGTSGSVEHVLTVQYDITIIHKMGKLHIDADAVSGAPNGGGRCRFGTPAVPFAHSFSNRHRSRTTKMAFFCSADRRAGDKEVVVSLVG